jgi:hypothetical protein
MFAGPIAVNQWYGFSWMSPAPTTATTGNSTPSVDAVIFNPGASPWTFNLAGPAEVIAVDGFSSGERFEIFDFGTSLGLTGFAPPGTGGCSGGDGPLYCLADPHYSNGFFLLGAGNHSITIGVQMGQSAGGAWFEAATVPEPSSLMLVIVGIGVLTSCRLRWASRASPAPQCR